MPWGGQVWLILEPQGAAHVRLEVIDTGSGVRAPTNGGVKIAASRRVPGERARLKEIETLVTQQRGSLPSGPLSETGLSTLRALDVIAQERGQSLAQMALAWTLRDARVTSTLIGASSVRQLEENVGALDRIEFSDDELRQIDQHAVDAGINLWAPSSAH